MSALAIISTMQTHCGIKHILHSSSRGTCMLPHSFLFSRNYWRSSHWSLTSVWCLCINQTFILPMLRVLISASSSAPYAWSISIFFTFVKSSVITTLTHMSFFGLDLWKIFEVHIVYMSAGNWHDYFFESPMATLLVPLYLCSSIISSCKHLTRTATCLLLCGG